MRKCQKGTEKVLIAILFSNTQIYHRIFQFCPFPFLSFPFCPIEYDYKLNRATRSLITNES